MPVPLAIVTPAALAALAYLNARTSFTTDIHFLSASIPMQVICAIRQRRDQLHMFRMLEERALSLSTANATFLWYQGQEWTYREMYDMVLRCGIWLKKTYNIKPKEVVAMDMTNGPGFLFLWWGIWSIGAIPAFINCNLTAAPLVHCIRTSTARVVIVDDEVRSLVTDEVVGKLARDGTKDAVEIFYWTPETERRVASYDAVRQPDETRAGCVGRDVAALIFTSGTTGLPKPAIVSWFRVNGVAEALQRFLGLKRSDRLYTCMPLYHMVASVLGVCSTLGAGCSIAIGHEFSTKTFWKEVRDSRATVMQYVGETCRYLLTAPIELDPATGEDLSQKHHLRLMFGNGMRPDVWERFQQRFNIHDVVEYYGGTEAVVALFNRSRNTFTQGAVGFNGNLMRFLLRSKVAVVEVDWETETPEQDPETGFCKKVKTGQPGEVLFQIPDANKVEESFQGYFGNRKATEAKILRDVFVRGDAWYRTGDVLSRDDEGRWYFHDRIGDTYRWKSENISTTEVAEVFGTHPAVREANVYGVSVPHHDGRAGMVALILYSQSQFPSSFRAAPVASSAATASASSPLLDSNPIHKQQQEEEQKDPRNEIMDSIAQHASKNLPSYAVPLFVRILKDNAGYVTGTNKQQKHILRSQGIDVDLREIGGGNGEGDGNKDGCEMYWLRNGTYVPFCERDRKALKEGMVKL
ncbi:MAG: Serine/threonine-protein kinase [Watsoniomyces obsoletus]|nr:MAG: Serine/threonine-protein kinase [Watsoniomyces obsoletus]